MDWKRIYHSFRISLMSSARKRANYIKRNDIFYSIGENCAVNFRKIPLYPKCISFGNNVISAANVTYVTHDVIHVMLNNRTDFRKKYNEYVGVIKVDNDVFIGANSIVMPNVHIGSNTIIGAGTLVNKDIKKWCLRRCTCSIYMFN